MKKVLIIFVALLMGYSVTLMSQTKMSYERYKGAYREMSAMLDGKKPLSVIRATYVAENAYLDGRLDYDRDFRIPISRGAEYMRRMIVANKWEKYKTAKQIALCNFFFYPCSGNGNKAFEYDYEELEDEWQHQLISKTLKTHYGQCRSLPWLFMLYAEELKADVYFACAPRHDFVMYRNLDNIFPEKWVCVETTVHGYMPLWGYKKDYEISDSAISVGTYLTPLTSKQMIAKQLSDLAFSYNVKFHKYDEFTLLCANKSLRYYKHNPNALIIKGKSLRALAQAYMDSNGGIQDAYTDSLYVAFRQNEKDLQATHYVEPTPEQEKKWSRGLRMGQEKAR